MISYFCAMKILDTSKAKFPITIKTVFGLEPALEDNLRELGYSDIKVINRGAQVMGSWEDVYKLNYELRCGISVLIELAHFRFENKDELYKNIRQLGWTQLFDGKKTFAIRGFASSKMFPNTQFPLLLAKDAIVDDFRARTGSRPNVDLKSADVVLDLHILDNQATVSINTSGDPLFKRGYRKETGLAPLNEVVAAGMIYLAKWDRKSTFVDPMCGSATLAIEAAMIATNTPAGKLRESYTFMHLLNFDRGLWEKVMDEADKKTTRCEAKIYASDESEMMINKARRNIRTLPFARNIELNTIDFRDFKKPSDSGIVISNPPYGERIGENVEALYKDLGDWMKQQMTGFNCWILSSNKDAFNAVGLKANKSIKMFNGSLPCEFRKYEIFAGRKEKTIDQV
jgi:putative N6-adenine-specific DNA methylase